VNLAISQPGAAVPQALSNATAERNELRNPLTIHGKREGRAKCYGYLDIETTGFSSYYCDLTVVGVAVLWEDRQRFGQLFGGQINADRVLGLLEGVDEIYTYNGSRFDLPFIKGALGLDLRKQFAHTDLMYSCWRRDLKGGLKAVEVRLGIERRLADMNGYMAVRLWWDYVNNNDAQALQRLLEYNREDVMNLHVLRERLGVK
jgi:uncharacterized protein YprB with RNaseH-like and TPR domain